MGVTLHIQTLSLRNRLGKAGVTKDRAGPQPFWRWHGHTHPWHSHCNVHVDLRPNAGAQQVTAHDFQLSWGHEVEPSLDTEWQLQEWDLHILGKPGLVSELGTDMTHKTLNIC